MKRKNSRTNPKDSPPIRTSFTAEIRSSEKQFSSAKAGEPKTSEYAFFKKLKTNAGHRSHSRALDKEEMGSKLLSLSDHSNAEWGGAIKNNFNDFRLPVEDVPCLNPGLFLSPVVKVHVKRAATDFGDICSTRKSMEEYSIAGRPQGIRNQQEDLFSRKRQKLHQWVTDTSFPEIRELCSKGYDFVSVLLSRLFPQINEEYSFKIPESVQGESNTLLSWPHSNIHLEKPHYMSTRNITDIECDPCLQDGMLTCWMDRSRDTALTNSDSRTCHGHNTLLDYNLRETSHELGGIRNTIPWIDGSSAFSSPSKNDGYLPPICVKELDDFQYLDGSLFGREKHPLLLGWDFPNVTKERCSAVNSKNTELVTYSTASTPWGKNHDRNLDEGYELLDASELCVSSVICKYPPNFYALPHSSSTSYGKHEFGSKFLEDHEEDTAEDLNRYSLALSHAPNNLCVAEDFNHYTTYKGSRTPLSPRNHHWFPREVSIERHRDPGTEAHLSSEVDFCLGRNCLSIKGSSNMHYSSIDAAVQGHQKESIFSHFLDEDKYENFLEFNSLSHMGVLNHIRKNIVDICDWSSFFFR
ncbi:uncharacterized protein LOC116136782 [Pistacia vera]|uniref:uncharacterized protein LOC116136782 n=1 Tax=Pistacia vera TaxID=55513 RepID=UPI0012638D8C|nr:uncharacterized protein LOC116136782 [Pistacia vera]